MLIGVQCILCLVFVIAVLDALPRDPYISQQEVDNLFKECSNVGTERNDLEKKLAKQGKVIKSTDRVADLCVLRNKNTDPRVRMHELKQLQFGSVAEKLMEKYNLSRQQIDELLPGLPMDEPNCKKAIVDCQGDLFRGMCDRRTRYRTADGTCNNFQNPTWGSSGVCFRRVLPARYVGYSGFRQSEVGGLLPQPRDLSLQVHSHTNRPTNYITHMYMFFGQLLDHDITQAPISVSVDNEPINCCPQSGENHPQCAPIAIRPDDPFYAQFRTTCMNFVRSAICATCTLGTRQQINQITAFIDASFVYGNSLNETLTLRANDGTGRLRVQQTTRAGVLPPFSPDPQNDQCSILNTSDICFQTGDARANQHNTLISLHTLFLREHNRLADGLRRINPYWDDERLFQEARRIVGAQMQAITYKEYLPATLGADRMNYFSLWTSNGGTTNYDETVDPSLYTEFSAAAFRFGHSLINNVVAQSPRTSNGQTRTLRNDFFRVSEMTNGIMGPLLRSVSQASAQWFDRYLVPDVTNFLYRIPGTPSGLDLASINIQRGRDHGLPAYIDMVSYCSDYEIKIWRFDDLATNRIMSRENMQLLQRNYRHVGDIDLWTGILNELPNDDAVVGPTGACIIGMQFSKLKFGDRFYFEHRYQAGSFTYQQIQELRKTTLSKIICLNTEVAQMSLNAMLFYSRNNPTIDCRNVQGVSLSYWRE